MEIQNLLIIAFLALNSYLNQDSTHIDNINKDSRCDIVPTLISYKFSDINKHEAYLEFNKKLHKQDEFNWSIVINPFSFYFDSSLPNINHVYISDDFQFNIPYNENWGTPIFCISKYKEKRNRDGKLIEVEFGELMETNEKKWGRSAKLEIISTKSKEEYLKNLSPYPKKYYPAPKNILEKAVKLEIYQKNRESPFSEIILFLNTNTEIYIFRLQAETWQSYVDIILSSFKLNK